MRQYRNGAFSILACIVGLAMAGTAHAQAPRSKVDMPSTPGVPEFRDPKTGQIWTPLNVGLQSGPPTPADLAFDPRGQAVYVRGVVVQRPSVVPFARGDIRSARAGSRGRAIRVIAGGGSAGPR